MVNTRQWVDINCTNCSYKGPYYVCMRHGNTRCSNIAFNNIMYDVLECLGARYNKKKSGKIDSVRRG